MKNLLAIAAVAFGTVMVSALSLVAGGVVAIAAVRRLRRK
jgi:hypothetical protein